MGVVEILEHLNADADCHYVEHVWQTGIFDIFVEPLTHFHTVISEILHEIIVEVFQKQVDFSF